MADADDIKNLSDLDIPLKDLTSMLQTMKSIGKSAKEISDELYDQIDYSKLISRAQKDIGEQERKRSDITKEITEAVQRRTQSEKIIAKYGETQLKLLGFETARLGLTEKIASVKESEHLSDTPDYAKFMVAELEKELKSINKKKDAQQRIIDQMDQVIDKAVYQRDIETSLIDSKKSERAEINKIIALDQTRITNAQKIDALQKQILANAKAEEALRKKSEEKSTALLNFTTAWMSKIGSLPGGNFIQTTFDMEGVKEKFVKDGGEIFAGLSTGAHGVGRAMGAMGAAGAGAIGGIAKAAAANPLGMILLAITAAFDRYIELDKAAGKFRDETKLTSGQMVHIAKYAREINVQYRHMGVGIDEAYTAAKGLVLAFSSANAVNKETLSNIALLSANIGIAEDSSAKVYQTFLGLGKTTSETANNIMAMTAHLSHLAGVPADLVFKDIASASSDVIKFLGKSPALMARTAIEARRLGTTLDSLAKSARGMLNFQESINSEMEATALTGNVLNFQLSRQLAFEGKIKESRQAALAQVKKLGDFTKMNVYQQEAVARAAGMTVEEITKMQSQEKMLAALKASGDSEALKNLNEYQNALYAMDHGREQNETDKAKAWVKEQNRQTEMNKMTNQLSALWTDIKDALLPIAQILIPIISGLVRGLILPVKLIVGAFKMLMTPLDFILKTFGMLEPKAEQIGVTLYSWTDTLETIGKWVIGLPLGLYAAYRVLRSMSTINPFTAASNGLTSLRAGATRLLTSMRARLMGVPPAGGAGSPAAAATSVAGASRAAGTVRPGTDIRRFLRNLADGLKAMADKEVLKGAINLGVASAGLVTMIPGSVGAFVVSKLDGKKLKSSLKGLGEGMEAMGKTGVFKGALGLAASAVGLALIIPGLVGMAGIALLGIPFAAGAKGMAMGMGFMGSTAVFKGALGIAAIGLAMIPLAFAVSLMTGLDWNGLGVAVVALIAFSAAAIALGVIMGSGVGAAAFFLGALAIAALGAAMIVFGMGAKKVSEAIVPLIGAFGGLLKPLTEIADPKTISCLYLAAGGIMTLGAAMMFSTPGLVLGSVALLGFGIALRLLAKPVEVIGKALNPLVKSFKSTIEPIKELSKQGRGLIEAAAGITAVALAFAAFGAGQAAAGLGSFVGTFLGGDLFAKLRNLSEIGSSLGDAAAAIRQIGSSISTFAGLNPSNLAKVIDQLERLDKMNKTPFNLDGIMSKMESIVQSATKVFEQKLSVDVPNEVKTSVQMPNVDGLTSSIDKLTASIDSLKEKVSSMAGGDSEDVVDKIGELTDLLKNGAIAINLDGRKVSSGLSSYS